MFQEERTPPRSSEQEGVEGRQSESGSVTGGAGRTGPGRTAPSSKPSVGETVMSLHVSLIIYSYDACYIKGSGDPWERTDGDPA